MELEHALAPDKDNCSKEIIVREIDVTRFWAVGQHTNIRSNGILELKDSPTRPTLCEGS